MNTDQLPRPTSRPHPLYTRIPRQEWARLSADMPLALSEAELLKLRGIDDQVSLAEVREIYLPLSRWLSMHAKATMGLYEERGKFLKEVPAKVPYTIGLAGSVAVGKSTTARVLRAVLAEWPDHPNVALVNTDGFLWPNAELEQRKLMGRKGFPQSYDVKRLLKFLSDVKSGERNLSVPLYSHKAYDVLPDRVQIVDQPDILIVEGLNVLQTNFQLDRQNLTFVSDFFDFSIFLDAEEEQIERWFLDRFMVLRQTRFSDPQSYFHQYSQLDEKASRIFAKNIWRDINGQNLRRNIAPTKHRADAILHKGGNHDMSWVDLRKI